MLATVLLGFVGGMGNLLGTLRLSENGLSPSGIGVPLLDRCPRLDRRRPAGRPYGRAAQPHRPDRDRLRTARRSLARPGGGPSTLAITAFLLASSAGRAGLNTFSYLLAGTGAQSAGAGRGTVIGLVNLSWGVAAVIGPLAASAAHGNIDERIPFGVIAALCLAVAAFMVTGSRPAAAT